jgi:hypothetical protein
MKNPIRIGRLEIQASRWPWQPGYNWHGMIAEAPLNRRHPGQKAAARFGGGWRYQLGVGVGTTTVIVNLLFGMITFRLVERAKGQGK